MALHQDILSGDLLAGLLKLASKEDALTVSRLQSAFEEPRFNLRQFLVGERVLTALQLYEGSDCVYLAFPVRLRKGGPNGAVAVLQAYPGRIVRVSTSQIEASWIPDAEESFIYLMATTSMFKQFPQFFHRTRQDHIRSCIRTMEALPEIAEMLGDAPAKVVDGGKASSLAEAEQMAQRLAQELRSQEAGDDEDGPLDPAEMKSLGDAISQALGETLGSEGLGSQGEEDRELMGRGPRSRIKVPTLH